MGRDLLLLFGVDLGEDDVVEVRRDLVIDGRERPARATPGRPEVHDHEIVVGDRFLEAVFIKLYNCHTGNLCGKTTAGYYQNRLGRR
jgi:hypothetical protein